MLEFNCSLLREKFVIEDRDTSGSAGAKPIIATSNRLVLDLRMPGPLGAHEIFAVRAQNMHSCVRMAAKIIRSFQTNGPILHRVVPFDWKASWDSVVNEYEYAFNPNRWVSVYNHGMVLFAEGPRHPFLDVVEKFDALSKGNYEKAVTMAEDGFKQAGKEARITHDSGVALVVNFEDSAGRCAIIMRGPEKTTTFNFSTNFGKNAANIPMALSASAAFLEGIQLSFMVGLYNEKLRRKMIEPGDIMIKKAREGLKRLAVNNTEILSLEKACEVRYRPEKPVFPAIIAEAEAHAKRTLVTPPQIQSP